MSEMMLKIGLQREAGYLYFIAANGDIYRVPRAVGRKSKGAQEFVRSGVPRQKGFLYFIKDGDIYRSRMKNSKE